MTTRAEEAAAAPSGLKEMQDRHPAVVYHTEKSLLGLFYFVNCDDKTISLSELGIGESYKGGIVKINRKFLTSL